MKLLDDVRSAAHVNVARSGTFRREISHGASIVRLRGALCGVSVAVDHLKVRQAPIGEHLRPRGVPVFTPHPKQGDFVINLGGLPKASASLAAAACLPRRIPASLLGAFQNCQAMTQAQCQVAFLLVPLSHKSICHPYRYTGCPHTQQKPGPFVCARSR
jgi:hypothetical protein